MKPAKKNPSMSESTARAAKLQGYAIWTFIDGEEKGVSQRFEIQQAVLRKNGEEIAIDCDCSRPGHPAYVYTISLRRETPRLFRGEWSAGKAATPSTGTCLCRFCSNGPAIALIGTWHEDSGTQQWLAELSPVEAL